MKSTEAYAELRRLGGPTVTTAQAIGRWSASRDAAKGTLQRLAAAGLVERLWRGVWIVGEVGDPGELVTALTEPYPAYVSGLSALAVYGMIDEVPQETTAVSLDRAKVIQTSRGRFRIQHVEPELFCGFEERRGYCMATPEKALFDAVYGQAARGLSVEIPEIELSAGFDVGQVRGFTRMISNKRVRTMVTDAMDVVLQRAQVDERAVRAI